MKKSALLRKVSAETGVPYALVKKVMDSTLEEVADCLSKGERVVLSGFGTFALRPYRARQWVNPQTGRQIDIPAALRPGFITSAALKRRLADAAGPLRGENGAHDTPAPAALRGRTRRPATKARPARAAKRPVGAVESA